VTRKGYLLATASSVAAVAAAGGSQAADMPLKAPRPTPVAAPTWAGWYIGLNAGANWQRSADSFGYAGGDLGPTNVTTRSAGFIGGGQIGYNWQAGNVVYGLEGDISGLAGHGNTSIRTGAGNNNKSISNQIRWLSTVRARAGFDVGNNTLAYVTGGLAVGGVKNAFQGTPGFIGFNKSESTTRVGWTVGGGIEHMLDNHWSIVLEGLFVDLGKSSVTVTNGIGPGAPAAGKTAKFSNQAAISRFKLNYKF
jgi:outer membrane immunogenic protein